jgi:CubicO group peptidase (beta-lactamase class C family)
MQKKKTGKRILLLLILAGLGYGVYFCSITLPIMSGYGAKNMCSAVFVAGRNEQQIRNQELNFSPMSLATFKVDYTDSSVTGSVFGFAKCKAIYRKGLGATLVSELSEQQIRDQHFVLAHVPAINQDTVAWPMGNKVDDSFPEAVNKAQLLQAIDNIFKEADTAKPIRTRAVVVVYDGKLIAEEYAPGFTKDTKLLGWSMTKSITSALIGLLVKAGKLNIDNPAPVPEWESTDDPRHAITIKDLLQQSSGLKFLEDYSKSSDGTNMLFKKADMGAYTASRPLKDIPGSVFYYSSGNTNILSRIIRQTVGEKAYHAFPYDSLFYKLGMYSVVLEPDASGTFVGSSYMYANARDWARFGLLYLNKGMYNNKRILSEDWIQQSVTPATSSITGEYGFQFWLNAGPKNNPAERAFPHAPTDLFYADGFEKQRVYIIPSKKLVVVRLGLTKYNNFKEDAFLAAILGAVK